MRRREFLLAATAATARGAVTVRTPAELTAAARSAQPGDRVVLADGEWRDADIAFEARGIRVCAQTPGQVRLTGRSRLRFAGEHVSVEGLRFEGCTYPGDIVQFRLTSTNLARHCRVTDCAFIDCNPEDPKLVTRWVSIYGVRNEVTRCYLAGKKNIGTTLVVWVTREPGHHTIGENWFGPRPALGVNGGESIRIGDSQTSMLDANTTVEYNLFERCNGELEIVSNKSCGNVYRRNYFDTCEGTLTLRHGNRCRVDNNVFLGSDSRQCGGIRVIGEDHVVVNNYLEGLRGTGFRAAISAVNGLPDSPLAGYFQVKRAYIAFNTIVRCAEPLAVGTNGGNRSLILPPEQTVVEHNVITDEAAAPRERPAAGPRWWKR